MSLPPDLPPSLPLPYRDRKTGLTAFGIMTMLIGAVCALFVPMMLFGSAMAQKAGAPAQDARTMIPGVVMYGSLAVAFFWLGIGSMKARRWARALLLILSWSWLLMGTLAMVFMAIWMPKILEAIKSSAPPGQPTPPEEVMPVIMVTMLVFMGVIMIIVPGVWVLFYRSRHVKATCEAEDPVERWTDRCPLPVLAVSLWLVFGVPMMLFMAVAYKGVLPFFGMFLVGPAASAIYLLLALLWSYAAWALYKLKPLGWWIVTASIALFSASAFLTYSRHNVAELYRLMEFPAGQIAQIEKINFLTESGMAWLTLGATLPYLGYLLFLRRYFRLGRG